MAARVTQHVLEVVLPQITYSPTAITGAGVTQHVLEAVFSDSTTEARVTQHVLEVVLAFNPDGSHGDTGGCPDPGGGDPVTHVFGWSA